MGYPFLVCFFPKPVQDLRKSAFVYVNMCFCLYSSSVQIISFPVRASEFPQDAPRGVCGSSLKVFVAAVRF